MKNILEDGTIDGGNLYFTRPYNFSLSGNQYSLTSMNVYVHSFDNSVYPTSYSSATGISMYATYNNSFSAYFNSMLMKLYNANEIAYLNGKSGGIYSVSSMTSSTTSELYNSGRFNPSQFDGSNISLSSFSAAVTSMYIFSFNREVYGDRILDGTWKIYNGNTLLANEFIVQKDSPSFSLSSLLYSTSLTSATKFWVFPDSGLMVAWSSSADTMNALSGISSIQFSNSVVVKNKTINLYIDPNEFNVSDNYSFYDRYLKTGQLSEPRITTIGLYNPWGTLIAKVKLPKAIRKTNVPITIKLVLDIL